MNQLPVSVKKLWRIGGGISGGIMAFVPAAALGTATTVLDWPAVMYGSMLVPVIIGAVVGVWWAGVKYQNWCWQITDSWIEAKHGVVGRHRVVIPRNRIQTVTTNSGPIDRMLDLETITVHTAGAGAPNLTIPHLGTSTVQDIRVALGQGVHA